MQVWWSCVHIRKVSSGAAQEYLGQYISVADGLGGAVVDDDALVEDVGAVDDVEDALDVVLDDHDGGAEAFADLGDL